MIDEAPMKRYSGTCIHTKVVTRLLDSGTVKYRQRKSVPPAADDDYDYSWSEGALVGFWVNTSYDAWLTPTIQSLSFDWSVASYGAMEEMRPGLEESLLLPNFIAELAEMGVLCRRNATSRHEQAERARIKAERDRNRALKLQAAMLKVEKRDGSLKKFRLPPQVPGPTIWNRAIGQLEKLAKSMAWLNLAYQFAVRPTVSDAKRLASLLDSYRRQLSELIRQGNTLQTRHYARYVDGFALLPELQMHQTLDWGSFTVVRKAEFSLRPKYRASMVFTYDVSRLKSQLGQIDNLLHALGVQKVASIIWEAIPYSFVIDWFVNVGDMIASAEAQLVEPLPILVHDFCHSVKYAYRTKLEFTALSQVAPHFEVRCDLAWREFSSYERRRDRPSLWDSLSVRSPSINQTGLGLSLLVLQMDGITKDRRKPSGFSRF
jgi:hypothetical protein